VIKAGNVFNGIVYGLLFPHSFAGHCHVAYLAS
jgi:hypothetical protein